MCKNRFGLSVDHYEISSKMAYLIGVEMQYVELEPAKVKVYKQLESIKNARIIRNLCIVRTCILKNFGRLRSKIETEHSSLNFATEFISPTAMNQLAMDGVRWEKKPNKSVAKHVIELNHIIADRINNCKNLFPIWLDWGYVKNMFLMPNGYTQEGVDAAKQLFFDNRTRFPYQMYINWVPDKEGGNMLYNDRIFASVLYEFNGDEFTELSKVSDASDSVKSGIYDFIKSSDGVVIAVDCENSDPYKMCATLRNLDEVYTSKISKIILIDDVNASSAWKILESHTSIPVEYRLIERVLKGKSLVDITLSSIICKEHYMGGINSIILFSSDSDYFALTSTMPEVDFYVMVEKESFSNAYRDSLKAAGMKWCYIGDFFTGNAEDIKFKAIFKELNAGLKSSGLNANKLLDDALKVTRATMSEAERKQFYDKYLKRVTVSLDESGNFCFSLVN